MCSCDLIRNTHDLKYIRLTQKSIVIKNPLPIYFYSVTNDVTMEHTIIGIRGDVPYDKIISYFTSKELEVVLFNPDFVVGTKHIESALVHAERAVNNGTNRTRSLISEIILYSAWERQIGKAVKRMKPPADAHEYVALVLGTSEINLNDLGMTEDKTLVEPSKEKAEKLGLNDPFLDYESQAVERVADIELLKT